MLTSTRCIKNLVIALPLLPMLAAASPTIEPLPQITVENNGICVDTAPVGDGYGWNGMCACTTENYGSGSFRAITEDKLLTSVGSPAACNGSQALHVYSKVGDDWQFSDQLLSTNNQPKHAFPVAVKIAGDTIAVSAGNDYDFNGVRYISLFQKDSGDNWEEHQSITLSNRLYYDDSVEFDGNTLAFTLRDVGTVEATTYVYERMSDGLWVETVQIDTTAFSNLVLDGNSLAIFDHESNDLTITFFEKQNGQWTETDTLEIPDSDRLYARSAQLDGNLLTVDDRSFEKRTSGEWIEIDDSPDFAWFSELNKILLPFGDFSFDIVEVYPERPDEPCFSCTSEQRELAMMSYQLIDGRWSLLDRIYPEEFPSYFYPNDITVLGQNITLYSQGNLYTWELASNGYFVGGELSTSSSAANDCDYSNASLYDGWGWNPVTGSSCEPLTQSNQSETNGQQTSNTQTTTSNQNNNGQNNNRTSPNPLIFSAVSNNATVATITPEVTAPQCVDLEPIGDGWGWNGTCACELADSRQYEGFGQSINQYNSTLFVSSSRSPQACFNSGSVLVYEIDDNEQVQMQAELLPSITNQAMGFGNGEIKDYHMTDDLLFVTSYPQSTVFGRENNAWSELYRMDRDFNESGFIGEELIQTFSGDFYGFKFYDAKTGQLNSSYEPSEQCEITSASGYTYTGVLNYLRIHEQLFSVKSSCGFEVYEKKDSGEVELQFIYEGEYDITRFDSEEITFSFLTSGNDTTEDRVTYTRNAAGDWTSTESVIELSLEWTEDVFNNTETRYSSYYPVANSNTVISNGFGFDSEIAIPTPEDVDDPNPVVQFHGYTPGVGWALQQEITYINPPGRASRNHYNEDGLFATITTSANSTNASIDSFYRDSSGEWRYLMDTSLSLNTEAGIDPRYHNRVLLHQNHLFITTNDSLVQVTAPITEYAADTAVSGSETTGTTTGNIESSDNCDYTNASLYNGWGWDNVAQQSCPPLVSTSEPEHTTTTTTSDCDYSNARYNEGWGWNAVTRTSCAPQSNDSTNTEESCIDSDGDGWGWNGHESCRV